MKIHFTNHALQRVKQRNISLIDIIDAIKNPDIISKKYLDGEFFVCFKKIKQEKYLLLVYSKK